MRFYIVVSLMTIVSIWTLALLFGCDVTLVRVGYEIPTPIATPIPPTNLLLKHPKLGVREKRA